MVCRREHAVVSAECGLGTDRPGDQRGLSVMLATSAAALAVGVAVGAAGVHGMLFVGAVGGAGRPDHVDIALGAPRRIPHRR
eukprot:ctg_1843.g448